MNLADILAIVLPVFVFMGIGYAAIGTGLLSEKVADGLGEFVFTIPVPLLLFRALGTFEMPNVSPWPLWLAYFSTVGLMIGAGVLITARVFGRDARASVIGGMSTAYGNLVMVGIPVVSQAFGEAGLVTIFLLISLNLPVMMTASAILIEVAEHRDGTAAGRRPNLVAAIARVGRSLVRNPLIIAIACGVAFRLAGWTLPAVPAEVVDKLSATAIPLALIALGMSLNRYGISGNVRPALVLGLTKLVIMPGLAYAFAGSVLGLPPLATAVVVIGAACPTGVNAYLIATRFQTGLALSANTITLTTAASIVSLTVWLAILGA